MRAKVIYWCLLMLILSCVVACGELTDRDKSPAVNVGVGSQELEGTEVIPESTAEPQQTIYASMIPMTFEEYIANATNIVSAKYLGVNVEGSLAYLSFEPVSQIKGQIEEETFAVVRRLDTVYTTTSGYQYTGDYSRYVVGEEYLLVLEKHVSVYYDCDRYYILGDIFIPKMTSYDATMFGRAELDQFISTEGRVMDTYKEISSFISEIAKKNTSNKEYIGSSYVTSTKLTDIVENSTYIFKVKVTELKKYVESNNTEFFVCTLSEVLKGEEDREKFEIVFVADTVEIGNEYVVLLNKVSETTLFYILSSINSVYSVSDTENIAIIEDALKGDHVTE